MRSTWIKVASKLMKTIPEGILRVKAYGTDSVKIQCFDVELFHNVLKYFTRTNTEFQSFSLPSKRTLEIVIKELLRNITEQFKRNLRSKDARSPVLTSLEV